MNYIKKFTQINESELEDNFNSDIDKENLIITITLEGFIIRVINKEGKKTLSINKTGELLIKDTILTKIVNELNNTGGEIELNEDDVLEISRIFFTHVINKSESINKDFILFS